MELSKLKVPSSNQGISKNILEPHSLFPFLSFERLVQHLELK